MSRDESSSSAANEESTLLLTKEKISYYVNKSGAIHSRDATFPHEAGNSICDDSDEESDDEDTSESEDSTASSEELDDEDTAEVDNVPKQCTCEVCTETTTQVVKQRKPWKCKEKGKNKNDLDENPKELPASVNKQRFGAMGDPPGLPSLLKQVLSLKCLSLLRSPDVVKYLQAEYLLLVTCCKSRAMLPEL